MKRYTSYLITILAIATAFVAGCSSNKPRPNFVVILCDDLGYGDLGCYGHPSIRTPNLDRLATDGVRLTDCYAAAPVCSPSRAGLLTGRTPTRLAVYDWIPTNHAMHLHADEITIATLLQRNGYATGHFGKWHCTGKFNTPDQPQPNDHGFDHWFSTANNAAPTHHNPNNFVRNGTPVGETEGFSCQIVANETISWLQRRDSKQPFFAFVCFHEPHEPIDSPEELVATYPDAKKNGEALYYANVSNMDRAVGQLMQSLDDMGLRDNTVVWFTSDNGPETLDRYKGAWRSHGSPGPLRGMKLDTYEGGIRVPGIVRWPKQIKPHTVSSEPVSSVDILPTFCVLAGIHAPTDRALDGTNVAPLFRNQAIKRTQPLFWNYNFPPAGPRIAIRDGDYKLLASLEEADKLKHYESHNRRDYSLIRRATPTAFELYDLSNDLSEQNDLASTERERHDQMARTLTEMFRDVAADAPVLDCSPRE